MQGVAATSTQPAVELNALLESLAGHCEERWISAALARRRAELEDLEAHLRAGSHWGAEAALQMAHLWLVAGVPGRGDDLVLEADRLLPNHGLIPDWWGLWPSRGDTGAERALAQSYVQLRHLPAIQAWRTWLQAVQHNRHAIDQAPQRLLLGLVIHNRQQLPGALEPALEQLMGEQVIQREPALAWRFFDALCERLPAWGYGRLKAADLSLERGELERCRQHLEAATPEQWQLAWLHDINARLLLAEGDVAAALTAWQRAIERSDQAEVVEIFRQRNREARRGPGVLQARSLLNRGDTQAAVSLLEQLLQQDPQWQPLRSLLEQARSNTPNASQSSTGNRNNASALEPLEARLHELALRADLNWPANRASETGDTAGFERFLNQALGRLALLG